MLLLSMFTDHSLSPTRFFYGVHAYWRGVKWLLSHKIYFFILLCPVLVGLVFVALGGAFFFQYSEAVVGFLLFDKPDIWYQLILYYFLKGILWLSFIILLMLGFLIISSIVASPIYEWVSCAVEKDILGQQEASLSFLESIKLMGEEVKKALFILTMSLAVLLIPVVNILTVPVMAWLLGWDYSDYALARRGWSFSQRLSFAWRHSLAVMGFGLWLCIPFVQILLGPLGIVGGTLLSLEILYPEQVEQMKLNKKGV